MRRQIRLILDSLLLGVVGGLSAQLFLRLLRVAHWLFLKRMAGYQPPGVAADGGVLTEVIGPHGLWLIPLVTTLGGLISGVLVYSLAPEAEGHGTDTVVKAFHRMGGFIRARVAPLKMVASAITIGSGGSAGREGPTALISAGVGSIYATIGKRTEKERRLLVLVGMSSGLSAIFRSPIGTAIFAIEVLYSDMEFEGGALLYTLLGSVVAYCVNGHFAGFQPLFQVPGNIPIPGLSEYFRYALVGVAAGLTASILPNVFYGTRDLFRAIPVPPHLKPAIGGLGLGLMALALPQVLGGGYGWIQEAINGKLVLGLLFTLSFAKMLALALTISSGGSGGVFAPSLYIGAMLGGGLARLFDQPAAAFVVVGMAAVFAGAARIPIATLLMVTEMTGGYHLFAPAALAVVLSYLIQVALTSKLKYKSLYEAQVARKADSPAHYLEQIEDAVHLLSDEGLVLPDTDARLNLKALLEHGIPVELPDGKQLALCALRRGSKYLGKSVTVCFPVNGDNDVEVVAVLRNGATLLPHAQVKLEGDDRILLIASGETLGYHVELSCTQSQQADRRLNNKTDIGF
jgi:CIC family chloride channel protein